MRADGEISDLSLGFAVRIVRLYQFLCNEKREYVLSKQLLRSGTGIGANVREAVYGQSKKDFVAKMSIALKEASETEYWLELLHRTDYLDDKQYISIAKDCSRIAKILTSIVKTTKNQLASYAKQQVH
jgi:four helix bundle protein